MKIEVPGHKPMDIENIVFDLNGTLAVDGTIAANIKDKLHELKEKYSCHILTAGTHGNVEEIKTELGLKVEVIDPGHEAEQKRMFVVNLGARHSAAVGNGANDRSMMEEAELSIAVCGHEGMSADLVRVASILVVDIEDALDLFLKPTRIIATLRR